MIATVVDLTPAEHSALQDISERTGRSTGDLIREAVDHLITSNLRQDRLTRLQTAKGLWKDRQGLSEANVLRQDWDRYESIL
ncbi:MAG: CopG family transcriptional regulator [Synechococcaceae cyanobacterium RM1_1_27]|nr:CopG family transcriptional regulator [Synechococcaceae cyanobacterium SM2_3_2]NJO85841.1 CopG family transcriptional regulator [Synechococcaceae cyanobacterium RM1_1_27]